MADNTTNNSNQFSYDAISGKINLDPLGLGSPSIKMDLLGNQIMSTDQTLKEGQVRLDIEAEKTVLNTAITPEIKPEEVATTIKAVETKIAQQNAEIDGRINVQLMNIAEKIEPQQIDMSDSLKKLQNEIKAIKFSIGKDVSSEIQRMESLMNNLVASTQQKYSSDYVISDSANRFFFDLKLAEVSTPPDWT
jgi:phage host-nuclease inhibitor protein Gam